jgi:TPR repeat protein
MVHLGDLFYYGHLGHDQPKAAKWFRQAAEKGNLVAIMRLGELYSVNHPDLASDHAEAAKWFRRAAEAGDPEGQYKLACLLLENKGVPQDPSEVKQWLQKSADLGNTKAQLKLALLNKDSAPDQLEALDRNELEIAAYDGRGEVRMTLATAYEEGRGGSVDLPKAVEGYWRILNLGPDADQPRALARLVDLYAQGKVQFAEKPAYGPKDPEDLGRRLTNAHKTLISTYALFQVGDLFFRGEVVPQDLVIAVDFLKQSALRGDGHAINRLGELWAAGVNGSPDPTEAAKWFRRAAIKGCAAGQLNLAQALQTGTGVAPDPVEAWVWFHLASDQGSKDAQTGLRELEAKLTPKQLESAKLKALEVQTEGSNKNVHTH